MIAWQVFARDGWLKAMVLRHHGGFSIDREGTDLSAIRQAREVLQGSKNPLFIFPEGDVYHCNDRITPFREGAAAIALMVIVSLLTPKPAKEKLTDLTFTTSAFREGFGGVWGWVQLLLSVLVIIIIISIWAHFA